MGSNLLSGVILTPLKQIPVEAGNVLHGLKEIDPGFSGFGEAYFSMIHTPQIKGWKQHTRMIMNVIVPVGKVKFVLYDDRQESPSYQQFMEVDLSRDNYQRLTIPSGLWVAFQGLGPHDNMLLNIASILHDPEEARSCDLDTIPYLWDTTHHLSVEA